MKNRSAHPPRDTTLPDEHHSTTGRAARAYTGVRNDPRRSERFDPMKVPVNIGRGFAALLFGSISVGILWVMAATGTFDWGFAITGGWFGAIAGYAIRAILEDH